MGLSISSAHCGNIVRPLCGRVSTFFAGYVPLLLKLRPILQRPFLIYELDVNSRNPIGPNATRSDRSMRCNALLLARQSNKTTGAPKGVTLVSLVTSVHSKSGVSRHLMRTGICSASRSRIRFQFRCSLMGADGGWEASKNVGSAYTKLLILLEFSSISCLPNTLKKG